MMTHREYVKTLAELERLQKLGQLSTGEYQTAVANLTAHRPRASFQPLMDD